MSAQLFDRVLKRKHKSRAAVSTRSLEFDYLRDDIADRLTDRLHDITRQFPRALDLGANNGHVLRSLKDGRGGIRTLVMAEESEEALHRTDDPLPGIQVDKVVADDELLPFAEDSFDVVVSSCSLQWANDLVGSLIQANRCLKKDGLLLCAIPGGDTLKELRSSFSMAEQERDGGVSPHISPMVSVRDAGDLLVRCGFAMPTVDVDEISVVYPDAYVLMDHLRGMAGSNVLFGRREYVPRETIHAMAAIYQSMYSEPEGGVRATFEVISMTAWKPDVAQPKPKERGSADVSMHDLASALETDISTISELSTPEESTK